MSELALDAFVSMEFNEPVYLGEKDGYGKQVQHAAHDSEVNLRPLVDEVRTYQQGVVLVMQSGHAVYVAYSNIRYAYFGLCKSPREDDEPSVGSGEKEHDELSEADAASREIIRGMGERMFQKVNEDQGPWPGKFADPEQSPRPEGPYAAPKRRGRPPKVRPEPEQR